MPILLPPPRWRRGGGFSRTCLFRWPLGLTGTPPGARVLQWGPFRSFLVAGPGCRDVLLTCAFSYTPTESTAGVDTDFYVFKRWDYLEICFWKWGFEAISSGIARLGSEGSPSPKPLCRTRFSGAVATPLQVFSQLVQRVPAARWFRLWLPQFLRQVVQLLPTTLWFEISGTQLLV